MEMINATEMFDASLNPKVLNRNKFKSKTKLLFLVT